MVAERTYDAQSGTVRIRYHRIPQAEIKRMTDLRLAEHVDYINRQLRLWNEDTAGKPTWFQEAAQKWRNALNGEKRRVLAELKTRTTVALVERVEVDEC